MTRRIFLVAKHEFVKTVFTRAFALLLALPLAVLMIPIVFGGGMVGLAGIASILSGDDEPLEIVHMHIADRSGALRAPESFVIEDEFEIHVTEVAAKGARAAALADQSDSAPTYLLVVHKEAMTTQEHSFTLYFDHTRAQEEEQVEDEAREWIRNSRFLHAGFDPEVVERQRRVSGERHRLEDMGRLQRLALLVKKGLPYGVLLLMYASASFGGNGLLTSTIEDRDNRMAEILLGSVSPHELMAGKILGHLGASLVLAIVWGGPVMPIIVGSSILAFVGPFQVIYVLAFVVLCTVIYASVTGSIGSTVSDIRQAQTLLTPLAVGTLVAMGPAVYVALYPETGWSLFLSLCPPFSVSAMAVRLSTEAGAPHYQVWISLLLSAGFAALMLAATGRIYRLGLLLRGSPPNLRTLLRWLMTP